MEVEGLLVIKVLVIALKACIFMTPPLTRMARNIPISVIFLSSSKSNGGQPFGLGKSFVTG